MMLDDDGGVSSSGGESSFERESPLFSHFQIRRNGDR